MEKYFENKYQAFLLSGNVKTFPMNGYQSINVAIIVIARLNAQLCTVNFSWTVAWNIYHAFQIKTKMYTLISSGIY